MNSKKLLLVTSVSLAIVSGGALANENGGLQFGSTIEQLLPLNGSDIGSPMGKVSLEDDSSHNPDKGKAYVKGAINGIGVSTQTTIGLAGKNTVGIQLGESNASNIEVTQKEYHTGNVAYVGVGKSNNSVVRIEQSNSIDGSAHVEILSGNNNNGGILQVGLENHAGIFMDNQGNSGNDFRVLQGGYRNHAGIYSINGSTDNDARVAMGTIAKQDGTEFNKVYVEFDSASASDVDVSIVRGKDNYVQSNVMGAENFTNVALRGSSKNRIFTQQAGHKSEAAISLVSGSKSNQILVSQNDNAVAVVSGSGATNNIVGIYQ
jgi:hypothetical protein